MGQRSAARCQRLDRKEVPEVKDVLEALFIARAQSELVSSSPEEREKIATAIAKVQKFVDTDRWTVFESQWNKWWARMFADGGMLHVKDRGHASEVFNTAWSYFMEDIE